ncbi:MAG: lytic transglycosylase domain-containing protein, partial [Acidobacteriota bacterium]
SYVDQNGIRTLSNIPPSSAVTKLQVSGVLVRPSLASLPSIPGASPALDSIIEQYAREYQLDPDLLRSIIKTESGFNAKAVSPKGAQGLMQLMPATAERLGVKNPFDPEQNVRGGARHMRTLLDTFDNDLTLSLAAYNAGENLVQRLGRIPNYRETQDYVRTVTRLYGKKEMAESGPAAPPPVQMFRFWDRNGVLHLTNIPPVEQSGDRSALSSQSQGTPE